MNTNQDTSILTVAALIVLFAESAFSQSIPAFPGAEGFGKWAQGGRGGGVIFVTTTEDNNDPGSLRYALTQSGPRTIIFRTGGTITLKSPINVENPYLTIAGQTAPGDGITIRGDGNSESRYVCIWTHNVIIRHIRVRTGSHVTNSMWSGGIYMSGSSAHDIIIDHASTGWGEKGSIEMWSYANTITIQNSIIAENLDGNDHRGSLAGGGATKVTYFKNLFAHNKARNPNFNIDGTDNITCEGQVVNNLVYNWEYMGTELWASTSYPPTSSSGNGTIKANIVGNYYKHGPNTIVENYEITAGGPGDLEMYVKGNTGAHRLNDSMNEWDIVGLFHGDSHDRAKPAPTSFQVTTPHDMPTLPTMSASDAYDAVLADVGATKPGWDDVDRRIINDVRNGTGNIIVDPSEVGGYPDLETGTPYADSDEDGMPDAWEDGKGLNPDVADHNGHDLHSQYTNLEIFLHSLAGDITSEPEPPTVAFTEPAETVVTEPAHLGVVAEAAAPGGSIDNVKLYLDETLVRREDEAPYEWGTASVTADDSALLGLTEGTYTLRLVATDTHGKTASDTIEITVEPAAVGAGAQALLSSPGSAEQMVQVFDLRGRRVFREAVLCRRRGDSHAMRPRTRGVLVVRSRPDKTPSARIVVLEEVK